MAEFHFIRPLWLLAMLPLIAIACFIWRGYRQQSGWQRIIPRHLQTAVLPNRQQPSVPWPQWLCLAALTLSIFALAGPTWERKPQPAYPLKSGHMVVLDMSLSMFSTDIQPNRLTQLQFKATDLVREHLDGDIGLIAYAGDAYTISPLTNDGNNLVHLIRALTPEIMPERGSNPLNALNLADQRLRDAGYPQGDIYWFTDGIEIYDQQPIVQFLKKTAHRLHILAVATEAGAPIKMPSGTLYRDASGQIIVPTIDYSSLRYLAEQSAGQFSVIRDDQLDLEQLTSSAIHHQSGIATESGIGDQWIDRGPWLLVVILVLVLPLARRGAIPLLSVVVVVTGLSSNQVHAQALPWSEQLWQTPYQQADQAIKDGRFEQAAAMSNDPWQRGTAHYRAGNFEQALHEFSQLDQPEAMYNQGNALLQLQRYDEAIAAYENALANGADWPGVEENLALAEQMKEQQQQQESGPGESQANGDEPGDNNEPKPGDGNDSMEQILKPDDSGEFAAPAEDGDQQSPMEAMLTSPPLTEEEMHMQQWLNKVPDDPAILLRNKMRLEAQKRRRNAMPRGVEKEW